MKTLSWILAVSLLWACGEAGDDGGSEADSGPDVLDAQPRLDGHTCVDECRVGPAHCSEDLGAVVRCVPDASGCLVEDSQPCEQGQFCFEGRCVPCVGRAGTFHSQTLSSGGETRYYYLHVPSGYDCERPWPLLVDLHGTATAPVPEELYGLQGAVATAEASGFILVRPRSRSGIQGGSTIFRWDQNPGDPERNRMFIRDLVDNLRGQYRIDPKRVFLVGFSSGTNQTAVLAADSGSPFRGYGFFGGGAWTVSSGFALDARYYFCTGYRDYMKTVQDPLVDELLTEGLSAEALLVRETDSGHDLYGWMYPEAWAFLDQGVRPDRGDLARGWAHDDAALGVTLVAASSAPDGAIVAVGQDESLFRRQPDGSWERVTPTGTSAFPGRDFTDVCFTGSGTGIAVGGGMVVVSPDGGATWEHREPIPDFTGSGFGYGYATAAACSDSRILAVGYWLAALSTDGIGWTAVDMEEYGYPAQVAAAAVAPWGTWIAAGYYLFAARSEDGTSFVRVNLPGSSEWVLDVVALSRRGYWVLVGDRGNIWRSTDDGFHFSLVHQGGPDLYAVGADGMGNVLAVGWGGTAYLSQDFGETWRHCPSGRTGFLGDVAWLPDGKALVVGQDGPFVFDPTSCP